MAKLTLTFDTFEEHEEMLAAIYGSSYMNVITELDEWLRTQAKHGGLTHITIEEMRAKLREETEGLPTPW